MNFLRVFIIPGLLLVRNWQVGREGITGHFENLQQVAGVDYIS
jgi:hypothetical protein